MCGDRTEILNAYNAVRARIHYTFLRVRDIRERRVCGACKCALRAGRRRRRRPNLNTLY